MPNESTNVTTTRNLLVLVSAAEPASDQAAGVEKYAGAADVTESGGEADTVEYESFRGPVSLVGGPKAGTLAVNTPALNPLHPAVRLAVRQWRARAALWIKYVTRKETLIPISGKRSAGIETDGRVDFRGDMPDLVDVEPGDQLVMGIEEGTRPVVVFDIATVDPAAGTMTVQNPPAARFLQHRYEVEIGAKTRGWFPAKVTADPAQTAAPAGGILGGVLNLKPRGLLPDWFSTAPDEIPVPAHREFGPGFSSAFR